MHVLQSSEDSPALGNQHMTHTLTKIVKVHLKFYHCPNIICNSQKPRSESHFTFVFIVKYFSCSLIFTDITDNDNCFCRLSFDFKLHDALSPQIQVRYLTRMSQKQSYVLTACIHMIYNLICPRKEGEIAQGLRCLHYYCRSGSEHRLEVPKLVRISQPLYPHK